MIMLRSKMDRDEFQSWLRKFGITAADACILIHNMTEAVISSGEVNKSLDRHGYLSGPQTAAFRLLFKGLENAK
jgi:hypothetical protein